jgi:carboxylesterase type B
MILYGGASNPPFHAGIAEYGTYGGTNSMVDDIAIEAQYQQLLQLTKCMNLACLRRVSEQELANAIQQSYYDGQDLYGFGDLYYQPVVDGTTILSIASEAFHANKFSKIPMITTHDTNEGLYFTNPNWTTEADVQSALQARWPSAGPSFFARLYQLYPASNYNTILDQYSDMYGDALFDCQNHDFTNVIADSGQKVWKQIFGANGGAHAASWNFIFNDGANLPVPNATLSELLRDQYVSFVVHGDPNSYASFSNATWPTWPDYLLKTEPGAPGKFEAIYIGDSDVKAIDDPDVGARCDFWRAKNFIVQF